MGYNTGTYTRNHNFSADASANIKILAARVDTELDDLASALTNVVWTRDGNTVPTVDIPMGGKRHINVGAPTSVNNYLRAREFIENIPVFMDDTASSADRISVSAQYFTSVSANQAPGDGTRILVRVLSNKSSAALYLNGHSANVEFGDGSRSHAMTSGGIYEFIYSSVDASWKATSPEDGRTPAEIAAGVTPTNYQYEPGDVRRYGQNSSASASTNKTALSNAIAANDDIDVWPGTYDNLTISSSNKRIKFRPGVTIKLPDDTVDSNDTSGPAVLGISGSNVTLVGDFTVDGNRANNDSSSFPTSEIVGSLHISGDNCRIEGEVFVTGAYHRGLVVQNGSTSGDEVSRLFIKKLRVYNPVLYAAMFWGVEDWQVDEIEVDIGTATASNGRVRFGSQSSSTVEARRGHVGTIRTNGIVISESNSADIHIDSVQCAGGKFEDSTRISVSLWTVDGSLMPSADEAGVSFAMITCVDCHVGAIIVDGHYQTAGIAVGFTQGNVGCSVDYISVNGTTSAVDDLTIGLNTDLVIGAVNLRGTSTGGDGLFFDYDANSDNIYIGAVHSTGHSNASMFDVRIESNAGTNTPLVIGYINEGATRSIGVSHRTDSFSWTSGTASQVITNAHCNSTSKVILIPRDADAAVIMHSIGFYVTPGSGSFQIFTGTGGNTAAQSEWYYIIYNGL